MQAVILAAGKGTRLLPITEHRSKSMLPILGKPITARVMEQVTSSEIEEFILVSRPDDEEFEGYFTRQSEINKNIRIVHQAEPLGTAHALSCAAPFIHGDFFLSACDNLTSHAHIQNMLSIWKSSPAISGLLTIMPVEPERISQVALVVMEKSWIKKIVEKPSPSQAPSDISSLPLYIFTPRILDYVHQIRVSDRDEFELPDAIQMLIDTDGRVAGISIDHRLTLTNPQDLISINTSYLAREDSQLHSETEEVGLNTEILPPVFIGFETAIGSHCTIGPNVYIENNCHVGNRVQISNAVLLRDSFISDDVHVNNRVVC